MKILNDIVDAPFRFQFIFIPVNRKWWRFGSPEFRQRMLKELNFQILVILESILQCKIMKNASSSLVVIDSVRQEA